MRKIIYLVLLLFLAMAGIAEEWMTFTTDDGLAHNECRCIAVDHDGVVWVGSGNLPTCTGGVSAWDGETWTTYYSWTTDFGLRSNVINDIFVDSDNNKWFATGTIGSIGGVTKFDGETWTYYNLDSMTTLTAQWANTVEGDQDNNIWVGSGGYVVKYDQIEWDFIDIRDFGLSGVMNKIYFSSENIGYFGSTHGYAIYNSGSFRMSDELSSENIRNFEITDELTLIGLLDGLYYRNDTTVIFTTESGLIHNSTFSIKSFEPFEIWIGTSGGLSVFNDYSWLDYRTNSEFPSYNVYGIESDLNNNRFLATREGLKIYNPDRIVWDINESPNILHPIKIYPNPFTIDCRIICPLGEEVKILDLKGRIVKLLTNNSGFVVWEPAKNIDSGIYIIGDYAPGNKTQKVTYIK